MMNRVIKVLVSAMLVGIAAFIVYSLIKIMVADDCIYGEDSFLTHLLLTPRDLSSLPMSGIAGVPEYQSYSGGGADKRPPGNRVTYTTSLNSDVVMREIKLHFCNRGYSYDGTTISKGDQKVWIAILGQKVSVGIVTIKHAASP
jgi:hypothetical protein